MSTTPEDRIKLMYKAMRKRKYGRDGFPWAPELSVARKFKISCAEVRRIVGRA